MRFSSLVRGRLGVVRKLSKAYYHLKKWKERQDMMENLYNNQHKRADSLEALLANGGVAPARNTSGSILDAKEDLPPTGICPTPSPRHRCHAKAALEVHGISVPDKVTMKIAPAQACLTATVKGQKRSTRVELYKEAGQSAKKGRLATSLSRSIQIDQRTLLHPGNLTPRQVTAKEKAEKAAAFLVRYDNSPEIPDKKDQKRVGNQCIAKRTLNDTMENLHKK